MPKKVVTGNYKGHKLTAENTWLNGATLFHNDKAIAINKDLFALKKQVPLMNAKIVIDEVEHLVEVFAYAIFTVKMQIKVNGAFIAGEKF